MKKCKLCNEKEVKDNEELCSECAKKLKDFNISTHISPLISL